MAEEEKPISPLFYDPSLLYHIKLKLDPYIMGEDKNKLLLFIIGLTSFMERPLGAIITGESSAGKSHLMEKVLQFFPNVEGYTRMTEASPDRMQQDFNHKILKIGELTGIEKAQSKLRVLISEGKLRLLTTAVDEETKKLSTTVIETNGVPCFITTTTNLQPDTELLNRLMMLNIDESEEQTKRILEFEANEFETISPLSEDKKKEMEGFFETLMISPSYHVLIPYAKELARIFPTSDLKARRDYKKLMYITQAVAFLHQFQRPIVRQDVRRFVIAYPIDFAMAWRICDESLTSTLLNLQQKALSLLTLFEPEQEYTTSSIASVSGYSQNRAREIMNTLMSRGYLVRDSQKREYKYRLIKTTADIDTMFDFVSVLKAFDEMELDSFLLGLHETRKGSPLEDTFIDPLTGESMSLSTFPVRVSCQRVKHKTSPNPQKKLDTTSDKAIVPNSVETTQTTCCICHMALGYEKPKYLNGFPCHSKCESEYMKDRNPEGYERIKGVRRFDDSV